MKDKKDIIKNILWIVFYLVIMDVAVNSIFKFPSEPGNAHPSFLEQYFEYGRSVEGKLDRMYGFKGAETMPILGYGWLQNENYELLPNKAPGNKSLIAIYGMSHAKLLGDAIKRIDSKYMIRDIIAPGAPVNWSFAAYIADKEKHEAKISILAVMTDSVPYISATAGTTCYFDMGHPYTFPRYFMEKDLIKEIYPPFYTTEGFKKYFFNSEKWKEYRAWLNRNDKYYDILLFKRSMLDKSSLFRVLRRSYSETMKQNIIEKIYDKNGFNLKSEEVLALQGIVRSFAKNVRKKKGIPIIYIVNNENRGDHLYKALKKILEDYNIPFLSTHRICPPDDPRVYLGTNSHFTPDKDIELAKEMIRIIENEMKKVK